MQSVKCSECGFVGWADAEVCKKCGAPVKQPAVDHLDQSSCPPAYSNPAHYSTFAPELKTGLAVTSLVFGIVNFLFLGFTGITIVAGVIVSLVALKRIKRDPYQYGGKNLAVAGLITNIMSVVVLVPVLVILAVAIPNVLAARRHAYEVGAIRSLKKIQSAETIYQSRYQRFGTLSDLEQAQLIVTNGVGNQSSYTYKVDTRASIDGLAEFAATAIPSDYPATGRRSFYIDESGVLRGADDHGLEANRSDPPINPNDDYPFTRPASRNSSLNRDDD
jgi:hypothetical protein